MTTPETQFKVTISKIGGINIGAGTKHTCYAKLNFDNFKNHDTTAKASAEPVWEDNISFTYSTKFLQRLSVKEIVVEMWAKNTFTADKLIGDGRVDLLTVFTGPQRVEIPIANKSHAEMGVVYLDIQVVQVANVVVGLSNLVLELDGAASLSSLPVSVGLSLPAAMKASSVATAVGGGAFAAPADITAPPVTTFANELFVNAVVISATGTNGQQLAAWLPVHQYYSYSDMVRFEVDLLVSGSATVAGTVRGRLRLSGLPEFIQMASGKYAGTASRVQAGLFYLEDVPRKPTCKIELDPRSPSGFYINRSTPPEGCVCPTPGNTRAGAASGRGRAGSTAAAVTAVAVEAVTSQLGSTLSFNSSSSPRPAAGAGADIDISGAVADAQNAIGGATAIIYSANSACQQLERAADDRASRAPAEEASMRELRRAVEDANSAVERLRASAASFKQKAAAASAAASRWSAGSEQQSALMGEYERLNGFLVEVESLKGTADEVLKLRQAAIAAETELRSHEATQAEHEAALLSSLRASLSTLQSRLGMAQSMAAQASSGAITGSHLAEAAGGLRAAMGDVQASIDGIQRRSISHASKAATLVANRDRVVSSVEKATSALMAAEAEVNANADSAAAAAKAAGIAALITADPAAAAAASRPALVSPSFRGGGASASPSGAGPVVLPGCWTRHVVPGEGTVYFQNEITRSTVWTLPTAKEYDVTWPSPTPLGIRLEEVDIPGAPPAPYGYPPLKACNLLDSAGAASNGARGADSMAVGHTLLSANGVPLYGKQLSEVLAVVTSMPRPLTLRFHDPYAVRPEVATQAADLRTAIEQGPMPPLFPPFQGGGAPAAPAPQQLPPQGMPSPGYGYPSMGAMPVPGMPVPGMGGMPGMPYGAAPPPMGMGGYGSPQPGYGGGYGYGGY